MINWLKVSWKKKLAVLTLILAVGWFGWSKFLAGTANKPQYQTTRAGKGTLTVRVAASGSILGGNSINITTQATGVVDKVYVKDGDIVSQGDKIADLKLDSNSQAKQASAWSSYLSAKNSLDVASAKINSLQAAEFKANQTFINDAVARGLKTDDPTYIQENALWLQAEADYKNQASALVATQAALGSSWLNYIQLSPTITAPTDGVVSGLTLVPGLPTGNATGSSSTVGIITLKQPSLQASVNLTEIDVTKVKIGQKVTLTLDAFPDETFTAAVSAINTSGVVSSGVTTYPATVTFDTPVSGIYPNMALNAKIITSVKDNVILVPSAAVQTTGGGSLARVMKAGKVVAVRVQVGETDDSRTEITSGINEGDEVVTGEVSPSGRSGSPFNTSFGGAGVLRPGGFGGGRGGGR